VLQEDQKLLYLQLISGNKTTPLEELEPFLRQRSNKLILGVPFSLYAYNFGRNFYDSSRVQLQIIETERKFKLLTEKNSSDTNKLRKIESKKFKKLTKLNQKLQKGNWWMRVMGSPPVIYDTLASKQTYIQFQMYLFSKGLFDSKVSYKVDTIGKSVIVSYQINEGKRYKIKDFSYAVQDGFIKRIINEHLEQKLISAGQAYDEQELSNERARIEKLLKDNGYYDFSKKYISFQVDSTGGELSITAFVDNPSENELHKVYKINSISVEVDNDIEEKEKTELKNIKFSFGNKKYAPKVLVEKLEIFPGDKFHLSKSQYSQRNLTQLDMFKFVNITYQKDSSSNGLKAYISANSLNKYQISDELGFTVSQGIPGPFGSITFTNRNVFNRCEIFDIGVRGGIEGVASASSTRNVYASIQFGVNSSFSIPRLLAFGRFNSLFINNNPRTRFTVGHDLIYRPEYDRSNTRFSATYTLQKGLYNQYSFAFLDVNYINTLRIQGSESPRDTSLFYNYLFVQLADSGNTLFRSFRNAINTDITFTYTYNSFQLGVNKEASFFRFYFEPGGTTLNLLNQNQINDIKNTFNLNSVYSYIKFNIDIRKYLPITKKSMFATRFNIGVANPYGGDKVMPYEKYFFTGGTNSNRAWLPRRLGPGSFSNKKEDGTVDYRFEQPGLILLEMNAEYRFKLIKFLDGAVFIDAGNIWNLNSNREGENISSSFYNEIAVGAGYGFRFDFSFLIVRLDAAAKVWDPGVTLSERFVAKPESFLPFGGKSGMLWNIAIGYPF
jgi:outer membrane protein assembly factor BamA